MRATKIQKTEAAKRKSAMVGRQPHHMMMLMANDDVTAAFLLDYLVSWWPNTTMRNPDGFWLVRSHKEILDATRLSEHQLRRALKVLEDFGTIKRKKGLWNVEGKGNLIHLWIQISPSAESALWAPKQ